MADLFQDYQKQHRSKKTLTIITASLVLAVSVNAFLFGTDTGARLQTSVMNSNTSNATTQKADIELVSSGSGTDMLKLRANSEIDNASRVFFSLAFDPAALEIADIFSENKEVEIVKNANVEGVMHITLLYKSPVKLTANSNIISVVYKKKSADKTVVNIAETQFKSLDGTIYELSSKGIEF